MSDPSDPAGSPSDPVADPRDPAADPRDPAGAPSGPSVNSDPRVSGLLEDAFAPLASRGRWPLAAAAVAQEQTGTWLSGAALTSAFHIGGVTMTFTALLLAKMVQDGRVLLEAPVSRYLPAASGPRPRLVDLATHTSGYPRAPREIQWRMLLRLRDPYSLVRDRDVDRALRRLSQRLGPPPYPFEFSNFGYGVLSRALAAAAGEPFGELLQGEVLGPLGLRGVSLETGPDPDRARLFGRNEAGNDMEHWRNPALPGGGFLFSTIEGMRRYLAVNLGTEETPLRAALDMAHEPRQEAGPDLRVGLAWLVRDTDAGPVTWQNGGNAGFGSFVGLDLARRVGVAVLVARRHFPELDTAAMGAIAELRRL